MCSIRTSAIRGLSCSKVFNNHGHFGSSPSIYYFPTVTVLMSILACILRGIGRKKDQKAFIGLHLYHLYSLNYPPSTKPCKHSFKINIDQEIIFHIFFENHRVRINLHNFYRINYQSCFNGEIFRFILAEPNNRFITFLLHCTKKRKYLYLKRTFGFSAGRLKL